MDSFEFLCRKCLPCRLNIAREKAIRAMHEAKMYENNSFLTLTYSEEHLESPRLVYKHFQTFIDSLRNQTGLKIPYMVTGEYGELNKRPHWHAILFNYFPADAKAHYVTELGEQVFKSETIDDLWGKNNSKIKPNEIGSVTMDSAGYVARYAAKKLVHGKDQEHDYHPIHKTSSKYGIGKTWIEKNWRHTFENGFVVLPNGQPSKIPRYYVDWLQKNKPDEYVRYITTIRHQSQKEAQKKARKEELNYISEIFSLTQGRPYPPSRKKVQETILKQKFKQLQEKLKL